MHGAEELRSDTGHGTPGGWYKELTRYHWFVLVVAALGWLFDTMDQQLFVLARQDAVKELLTVNGVAPEKAVVDAYGPYATSIFMIGWATGGIFFGILGDRIGRVKTMIMTILVYSIFTGLSALSRGFVDFAIYRFLAGLGVGGEFAVGVALVAETMPDKARPFALGLLQALSAIGNITAALVVMILGKMGSAGMLNNLVVWGVQVKAWRIEFLIGVIPALLTIVIQRKLKEPERWKAASADGKKAPTGSFTALFGDPRWKKRALVGLVLASSGVIGLWSVGFFSSDLVGNVVRTNYEKLIADEVNSTEVGKTEVEKAELIKGKIEASKTEIDGEVNYWKGISSFMINIGAFLGVYGFAYVTHYTGRRGAFAISFLAAFISSVAVFSLISMKSQVFWMIPIMGFCQLSLFGGYAIYFPELFPTYLRSTGTSFCYNCGRFISASGPLLLGQLTSTVFKGSAEPLRWAGASMSCIFLVGLLALPFAPETKGQPLPE